MRIAEIFRSLQGEGVLIGTPTVFIRTVGCNLRCDWCDTAYAWDGGVDMTLEDVARKALSSNTEHVCLTGGEPLLQAQTPALIDLLVDEGRFVTVETNGSMDITSVIRGDRVMVSMDIKCPSSGMADRMDMANLERLREGDQLKFVMADTRDMEYAENILRDHEVRCQVVFSPVGGVELRALAEWTLAHDLDARVLPQLHKLIWGERRGV